LDKAQLNLWTRILAAGNLAKEGVLGKNLRNSNKEELGMEIDYSEIQRTLDQAESESGLDFAGLVADLLGNGEALSAKGIIGLLWEHISLDLSGYGTIFLQIAGIAIGAAVLKSMTESFQNRQVSETGFFVTYLLLFAVLLSGFALSFEVAKKTIGWVVLFMQCLVPAYSLAVAFCTGSATSLMFYQGILLIISLVELVVLNILLPLVNVYLILMLVNRFSKEESLKQMADLVRQLVMWGAKTLFGLVIGIQMVQGLILPVSDKVKRSLLYKTAEMIPGIGNAVGGVTETVLGTGLLLKNAVGVAGLLVLILVCAAPFGKLLLEYIVCKLSAGVLQPISDKRIIGSLEAAAEASRLLLYLTGMTVLMFAVAVSLVAASTGIH
jgi:stage III sporulation protein AE